MEPATHEQIEAVHELREEKSGGWKKIKDEFESIPGGWQPGDDPMPAGVSHLSLDIGGELPTQSVLKFSGSTDLDGYELKKGSVHRYEVEIRIDGEGAKDSYDKHGNLKVVVKEQTGTILSAERV